MLTLFHDPTSPAAAVAVLRLGRLAEEGLEAEFEGFDVLGVDISTPVDIDTLALIERLALEAAGEGIQLRRPRVLPPTALAHVLLHHAEASPHARVLREQVYRAFWQDGVDISDPDALVEIATQAGCDRLQVATLLADRVALASRRRQMAAHRRNGVGGVPVILASQTLIPGLLPEDQLRAVAAGA